MDNLIENFDRIIVSKSGGGTYNFKVSIDDYHPLYETLITNITMNIENNILTIKGDEHVDCFISYDDKEFDIEKYDYKRANLRYTLFRRRPYLVGWQRLKKTKEYHVVTNMFSIEYKNK